MSWISQLSKTIYICLAVIIAAVIIASFNIDAEDVSSYTLHQISTALCVALLLWAYCRYQVSNFAFVQATGFVLIHILGAHYLYSYVPYNEWIQALFGFDLNAAMGWERNMYDRLVHFSYGLLLFLFCFEVFASLFPQASRIKIIVVTLLFNMSGSMLYELLEWGIAITLSPENAEKYNGQQGDMWDAHKDMAIALVGGIVAAAIVAIKRTPVGLQDTQ